MESNKRGRELGLPALSQSNQRDSAESTDLPSFDHVVVNAGVPSSDYFTFRHENWGEIDDQDIIRPPQQVSRPKRQRTWYPPIRVPLAHRKLVHMDSVLATPTRPKSDYISRKSFRRHTIDTGIVPTASKTSLIRPIVATAPDENESRDRYRTNVMALRHRHPRTYDQLVARYKNVRNLSPDKRFQGRVKQTLRSKETCEPLFRVEDAILLFLEKKHKHHVCYLQSNDFRKHIKARRTERLSSPGKKQEGTKCDDRMMPYDLVEVSEPPDPGNGDYYILSGAALMHHPNNAVREIEKEEGEVIPLDEWILERQAFTLILAGIPLFQKFTLRRLFVQWKENVQGRLYHEKLVHLSQVLPFAQKHLVQALLTSLVHFRRMQSVYVLELPLRTGHAISMQDVVQNFKILRGRADSELLDAKECALVAIEAVVTKLESYLHSEPIDAIDSLSSPVAKDLHILDAKWKSPPLSAIHYIRDSLHTKQQAARHELKQVGNCLCWMAYVYAGSLYKMVLGNVQRLAMDLQRERNAGCVSIAVRMTDDGWSLTPACHEVKEMILEAIAQFIRLASSFHFSRNTVQWSEGRGNGKLAFILRRHAGPCEIAFSLGQVLRIDRDFDIASSTLLDCIETAFERGRSEVDIHDTFRSISKDVHDSVRRSYKRRLALELALFGGKNRPSINSSQVKKYEKSLLQLEASYHTCAKLQSMWKAGFLEVQCHDPVVELQNVIHTERHEQISSLEKASALSVQKCIEKLQRAIGILDERPQVADLFCRQVKEAKVLKEDDKRIHKEAMTLENAIITLKNCTTANIEESQVPMNLLRRLYAKYTTALRSQQKFEDSMMPVIIHQVSIALQKNASTCHQLYALYDEHRDLSTEDELEEKIGLLQSSIDQVREIALATTLYQAYQEVIQHQPVVVEALQETVERWEYAEEVIESVQEWRRMLHTILFSIVFYHDWVGQLQAVDELLHKLERVQEKGSVENNKLAFGRCLLQNVQNSMTAWRGRMELLLAVNESRLDVQELNLIADMLDLSIVCSETTRAVMLPDGSPLLVHHLEDKSFWQFALEIRQILEKSKDDKVIKYCVDEISLQLKAPVAFIIESSGCCMFNAEAATQAWKHLRKCQQNITSTCSSKHLTEVVVKYLDEVRMCQKQLTEWMKVEREWEKMARIYCSEDVVQYHGGKPIKFTTLSKNWQEVIGQANTSTSLGQCLLQVVQPSFLKYCRSSLNELASALTGYLDKLRQECSRFNFISNNDLIQVLGLVNDREVFVQEGVRRCFPQITKVFLQKEGGDLDDLRIVGIQGLLSTSSLEITPVSITSCFAGWMKELDEHIRDAMQKQFSSMFAATITPLYEGHFSYAEDSLSSEEEVEWTIAPCQLYVLGVQILLTTELEEFAKTSCTSEWDRFWQRFGKKIDNLSEILRLSSLDKTTRCIARCVLIALLNREPAMRELQEQLMKNEGVSTTALFISSSLMRFHYFHENQSCAIYHGLQTYDYGFSFLGSMHPIATGSTCDTSMVSISNMFAVEVGVLVSSSALKGSRIRDKELVYHLAATVGIEPMLIDLAYDTSYLHRMVDGVIQTQFVWGIIDNLKEAFYTSAAGKQQQFTSVMSMLYDKYKERLSSMTRPLGSSDKLHSYTKFIALYNMKTAQSWSDECRCHLEDNFAAITIEAVDRAHMLCTLATAEGLVEQETAIGQLLDRVLGDLEQVVDCSMAVSLFDQYFLAFFMHKIALQFGLSTNKSLVSCVQNVIIDIISPSMDMHRLSFLFHATHDSLAENERVLSLPTDKVLSPLLELGLDADKKVIDLGVCRQDHDSANVQSSVADSRSGSLHELCNLVRANHFIATDTFLRSLSHLKTAVQSNDVVVLVGDAMTGKSTAISLLRDLYTSEEATYQNPSIQLIKMYPEAYLPQDLYGSYNEDNDIWMDGHFTRIMRQEKKEVDTTQQNLTCASQSLSSHWIVLSGGDCVAEVIERLDKHICQPVNAKHCLSMLLPNSDHVKDTIHQLKVLCEVDSLANWSPDAICHTNIVSFHSEESVSCTALIGSWRCRVEAQYKDIDHARQFVQETIECVVMHLESLVDFYQQTMKMSEPCPRLSNRHLVHNVLGVLSTLIAEVARALLPTSAIDLCTVSMVFILALTMSLGSMATQTVREAFHYKLMTIFPMLLDDQTTFRLLSKSAVNVFDIGFDMVDGQLVLYSWKDRFQDMIYSYKSNPSSSQNIAAQTNSNVTSRHESTIESTLEDLYHTPNVFIPTGELLQTESNLRYFAKSNLHAFIYGKASTGKSTIVKHAIRQLQRGHEIDAQVVQTNASFGHKSLATALDGLGEHTASRKRHPAMPAKSCLVLLENLNLESDKPRGERKTQPSSSLVQQLCDTNGFFSTYTKRFVKLANFAVWITHTTSPTLTSVNNYSPRLLRHFHFVRMCGEGEAISNVLHAIVTSHLVAKHSLKNEMKAQIEQVFQYPRQVYAALQHYPAPMGFSTSSNPSYLVRTMQQLVLTSPSILLSRLELEKLTLYTTLQSYVSLVSLEASRQFFISALKKAHNALGFKSKPMKMDQASKRSSYLIHENTKTLREIGYENASHHFKTGHEHLLWSESGRGIKGDNGPALHACPKSVEILISMLNASYTGSRNFILRGGYDWERFGMAQVFAGSLGLRFQSVRPQSNIQLLIDQIDAIRSDKQISPQHKILYIDHDVLSQEERLAILNYLQMEMFRLAFEEAIPSEALGSVYVVHSSDYVDATAEIKSCCPTLFYQSNIISLSRSELEDNVAMHFAYNNFLYSNENILEAIERRGTYQRFGKFPHQLEEWLVHIHSICSKRPWTTESYDSTSRYRDFYKPSFEGFLERISKVFAYQMHQRQNRIQKLGKALYRIDEMSAEITTELAEFHEKEQEYQVAVQNVVKAESTLHEHETAVSEARDAFLRDDSMLGQLRENISYENDQIKETMNHILPELNGATQSLMRINKHHIREMKSFVKPPQQVRLTMQAVCVLLGVQPTWEEGLRLQGDMHFINRLTSFDKDSIHASVLRRVKVYTSQPEFSVERVHQASVAATTICEWVLALVKYTDMKEQTAPLQRHIDMKEEEYQEVQRQVQSEKTRLASMEIRLQNVRSEWKARVHHRDACQANIASQLEWKEESIELQGVLNEWRRKMNKLKQDWEGDIEFWLLHDCVIVAGIAEYMNHESSDAWIQTWKKLLAQSPYSTKETRRSFLRKLKLDFGLDGMTRLVKNWMLGSRPFQQSLLTKKIGCGNYSEQLVLKLAILQEVARSVTVHPVVVDPFNHFSDVYKALSTLATRPLTGQEKNVASEMESSRCSEDESPYRLHYINDSDGIDYIKGLIDKSHPQEILAFEVSRCTDYQMLTLLDTMDGRNKLCQSTYFIVQSIDCVAAWKPKIQARIRAVSFSMNELELQAYMSKVLCRQYARKLFEDMTSLQMQQNKTQMKDRAAVQETIIELMKTQMTDKLQCRKVITNYLHHHKEAEEKDKCLALQLEATWKQIWSCFEPLARATLALLKAEAHFNWIDPALKQSPLETKRRMNKLVRKYTTDRLKSTQLIDKDSKAQGVVDEVIVPMCREFVTCRLCELPRKIHKTYKVLIAVSIGEAKDMVDPPLAQFIRSLLSHKHTRPKAISTKIREEFKLGEENLAGNDIYQISELIVEEYLQLASFELSLKPRDHSNVLDMYQDKKHDMSISMRKVFMELYIKVYRRSLHQSTREKFGMALIESFIQEQADWDIYQLKQTVNIDDSITSFQPKSLKTLNPAEKLGVELSYFGDVSDHMTKELITWLYGEELDYDDRLRTTTNTVTGIYEPLTSMVELYNDTMNLSEYHVSHRDAMDANSTRSTEWRTLSASMLLFHRIVQLVSPNSMVSHSNLRRAMATLDLFIHQTNNNAVSRDVSIIRNLVSSVYESYMLPEYNTEKLILILAWCFTQPSSDVSTSILSTYQSNGNQDRLHHQIAQLRAELSRRDIQSRDLDEIDVKLRALLFI